MMISKPIADLKDKNRDVNLMINAYTTYLPRKVGSDKISNSSLFSRVFICICSGVSNCTKPFGRFQE